MSRERRQIVERWRKGDVTGLITLVATEGSSYRRPGARMLLGADGDFTGSISGGCLEAEMARKAAWMARDGAVVRRISTFAEDDEELPFGMGCGGTLDLLIESAGTPEFVALLEAMEQSLEGEGREVVTFLPATGRPMRRQIRDETGKVVFQSEGLAGEPGDLAGETARYTEVLEVPQRFLVIGAGDDARPVVSLGALLGWDVIVADGRSQLARPERFPEARQVMAVPGGAFERLAVREEDAVVVMTHSYEQDRSAVAAFVPAGPRYLGLLGARHRSAALLSEVAETTGLTLETCCAAVHTPIGLDLGGDGPDAIALAIVAEVQACCMGKPSGSLRLSPESVLAQLERDDGGFRPATRCALETV